MMWKLKPVWNLPHQVPLIGISLQFYLMCRSPFDFIVNESVPSRMSSSTPSSVSHLSCNECTSFFYVENSIFCFISHYALYCSFELQFLCFSKCAETLFRHKQIVPCVQNSNRVNTKIIPPQVLVLQALIDQTVWVSIPSRPIVSSCTYRSSCLLCL